MSPRGRRTGFLRYTFALIALLLMASPLWAQQSYFRLYDQTAGLNVGEIAALAQDDAGFIWIGAHRGLVRFDGRNFIAWMPDKVDELVTRIVHGPNDELLLGTASEHVWRRTDDDLQPLVGPNGTAVSGAASLDFDASGNLWLIIDHALWQRDTSWHWQRIERGLPPAEKPRSLRAFGASVVVLTDLGAWRLDANAPAQLLLRQPNLWSSAGDGAETFWLTTHFGRVWKVDAQGARQIQTPNSRVLDLRMRGKTLWLAFDTQLLAIEGDGRTRRIDVVDGLPSGGPLLVDRENSLWLGSFVGLVQFPEPDTWHWGLREGLPSIHAHGLVEADHMLWVSTWANGLARIDEASGALQVASTTIPNGDICVSAALGIFAIEGDRLVVWHDGGFRAVARLPQVTTLRTCTTDSTATAWISTEQHLFRLTRVATGKPAFDASEYRLELVTLDPDEPADLLWFANGQLYRANQKTVCRIVVAAGNRATLDDCVATATALEWDSYASIDPRRGWIAAHEGVYEFDGTQIRRLRGNHQVEGGVIQSLTPASGGDWWGTGAGALFRLRPCNDCSADWQIEETPGLWQGLPGNSANSVVETANGDLWVAGNRGVWRVPRQARDSAKIAPTIALVDTHIDATSLRPAHAIVLQPDDHRLELEFAALSFRDRSLLRYRSRIGDEGEWSAPSRDPRLQFAALEPGRYRAQMSASVDGVHWSAHPAVVDFRVLPPWYRTLWARAVFVALALVLLALLYRLRVASLLRVETERTRIAMDLHDEIGAGLGSIGMLAGAAARSDSTEQLRIVREISEVSTLLSGGLRSLVWSLRSGNAGLADIGQQIADHARRLFPGDQPRLSLRLPAAGNSVTLAPHVRRHLLLFTLEALHNVSKHAAARRIEVQLDALVGHGFRLRIDDDGRGYDSTQATSGSGLESMRRRARAIGADLRIVSAADTGTQIVLTFPKQEPPSGDTA